jgi:hypothetical protein
VVVGHETKAMNAHVISIFVGYQGLLSPSLVTGPNPRTSSNLYRGSMLYGTESVTLARCHEWLVESLKGLPTVDGLLSHVNLLVSKTKVVRIQN